MKGDSLRREDDILRREYMRQYARLWRLLREHGQNANTIGVNLLLDCIRVREQDIERLRERIRG